MPAANSTIRITLEAATEKANARLNEFFKGLKTQMKRQDDAVERQAIEQNALLTNAQRIQQLRSLNAADILKTGAQLAQNITAKPANDEAATQQLEKRKQLQQELNDLLLEQRKLQEESGTSFVQSFGAMFAKMKSEAEINFNTLANTFQTVFNSAISSVSHAITGLIMGTENWHKALLQVGESILTTLVQSVVQLAVRWIATQLMMAIAGKAIMAAAVASQTPLATAAAAIWSTPATLATIASYGAAAAAAPGFISLAEGLVMAQTLGSFKEGGFTGSGSSNEVAGLVHRGEFVVPAERVNQVGLGFFEAIRSGQFSAASFNAASAPHASDFQQGPGGAVIQHKTELSLATFGGEADAKRWAEGQDGETWFLNMMNKHAYRYQQQS